MSEPILFVGTPVRDGTVHVRYMQGLLRTVVAFNGRIQVSTHLGNSLCRARDELTSEFLDSKATHAIFVDSDIEWGPENVQKLIDSGKDFISGCYSKRKLPPEIPAKLLGTRDEKDPNIWEAEWVPAGFLMITRLVAERMTGAYHKLRYNTDRGNFCGIWAELFEPGCNVDSEDVSFCRRWSRIGGKIWLHQGVHLPHHGSHCFTLPETHST